MNLSSGNVNERHIAIYILLIVGTAIVFENKIDRVYCRLAHVAESGTTHFGTPTFDKVENVGKHRAGTPREHFDHSYLRLLIKNDHK